jgi:hypothetical protein
MLAALRWEPPSRTDLGTADVELGPDGVAFVALWPGSSPMPFRDTGEKTADGLPVFEYAL